MFLHQSFIYLLLLSPFASLQLNVTLFILDFLSFFPGRWAKHRRSWWQRTYPHPEVPQPTPQEVTMETRGETELFSFPFLIFITSFTDSLFITKCFKKVEHLPFKEQKCPFQVPVNNISSHTISGLYWKAPMTRRLQVVAILNFSDVL